MSVISAQLGPRDYTLLIDSSGKEARLLLLLSRSMKTIKLSVEQDQGPGLDP